MRRCSILLTAFLLLVGSTVLAQNAVFNADSAFANLKYLSVTIGPRPMGSAEERQALQWASDTFRRFGADTAYVMPVPRTSSTGTGGINTNSGVAVGIFKGETDSTIVIGGHIDSAGREIPGANDDGSGTACVVELARVWSQRARHYTLLFAAFCGEEQGLIGSKYFVANYPHLNRVALMLQIDMSGSDEFIVPFFDTKDRQAPAWLVEDAYAMDRALGSNSLYYPTHFFSINAPLGGAGSDHEPFLEKDIPAIDFTAGINSSPIHTPEDKIDFITPVMLARSGNLVDGLLEKYQQHGIPPQRSGHYMLWQVFGGRLFIPMWLIIVFDVLALALGVIAVFRSRANRLQIEKSERVRFSGFKLALMLIVVAIFVQLGEAIMQLLKGLRYPWLAPFDEYLWFAALWATAGVWAVAQLTRKWQLSPDPYVYAKRAAIFLILYTVLFALLSARTALYPALALLGLSLAVLLPGGIFKLIVSLLAAMPMFRLLFMEALPLFARTSMLGGAQIDTFWLAFLFSGGITLLLFLWFLPTLYLLAHALAQYKSLLSLLKPLRSPVVGLAILLAIFGFGGYIYSFQAYNDMWRAQVSIATDYNLRDGSGKMMVVGNEYFRNVRVDADTLHRRFDGRFHKAELPIVFSAAWLNVTGNEIRMADGDSDSVRINWQLVSAKPWYHVSVTLKLDSLAIGEVQTPLAYKQNKGAAVLTWFADPPDTLTIDAQFRMTAGRKLIREVEAIYPEPPVPMRVTADIADVRFRTTVTYRDTLVVPMQQTTGLALARE